MEETKTDYYFNDMDSCPCKDAFENITYVWEAIKEKDKLLKISHSKIESELPKTIQINGFVIIGKDVSIGEFVNIEGPVIIGDGSVIKKGAYIRPGSIIGKNCKVGHNSEVKNSILFDSASISEKSYVGDSILGKESWIATGVTLGNYKINKKPIKIFINDKCIETNLRKMGCIIGDKAVIGNNITFNPGTLLGPNTSFYMEVPKFFPRDSYYKIKQIFEKVR